MFPDFIGDTIEEAQSPCYDCKRYANAAYTRGEICCGILKHKHHDVPADVIRLCIEHCNGNQMKIFDFAPDEALDASSLLSLLTCRWLQDTKVFQAFRYKKMKT